MKTREIEGFVYVNHLPFIDKEVNIPFLPEGCHDTGSPKVKAKLIIEVPEREIKTTETKLVRALTDAGFAFDNDNLEALQEILFNQGGEE